MNTYTFLLALLACVVSAGLGASAMMILQLRWEEKSQADELEAMLNLHNEEAR